MQRCNLPLQTLQRRGGATLTYEGRLHGRRQREGEKRGEKGGEKGVRERRGEGEREKEG